jgi:hypothetical protein
MSLLGFRKWDSCYDLNFDSCTPRWSPTRFRLPPGSQRVSDAVVRQPRGRGRAGGAAGRRLGWQRIQVTSPARPS